MQKKYNQKTTQSKEFTIEKPSQLKTICSWLAKKLKPQTIVLLEGPLGGGKTALVKYLAQHFNFAMRKVKSPTFSILNTYRVDNFVFHHLDLYRLDKHDYFLLEEMKELLSEKNAILLIEWPEKMQLSELYIIASRIISIKIDHNNENFRKFHIITTNTAKNTDSHVNKSFLAAPCESAPACTARTSEVVKEKTHS